MTTVPHMDDGLTRTSPPGSTPSRPSPPGAGRFVPGAILDGRYRIVTLVGRGGMGEVYKADDLKLEQSVALKFLPDALALNPQAIARFHAEVRIARQVSHPHVCRVYDVGEVDGLHFLTMEFIDGEDLASLLRRIGRLPADKAVEVARQISAGLAAAHDAGVLHRDLKPANVMIDGRGRARMTDFGVAAIARDIRSESVLAGTPAYMPPEVLKGEEATVRSDVYALGLVLYEMFTGKRAVDARTVAEALLHHSSDRPVTTPSSWIADLDPVVERAILRCLERDPVRRPASAIQVAASLPGGDPLQAALAAGETPSPEMVAAAGSRETLQPALGAVLLAATVVLLLLAVWGKGQVGILSAIPIPLPPEVLAHNAREMLTSFGYPEPPRDTAHGLEYARPYLVYARRSMQPAEREWLLRAGRPPAVLFWYRESPVPMVVVSTARPGGPPRIGPITVDNPPPVTPGMLTVRVDTQGHLVRFEGQPPEFDDRPATVAPFDWTIAMRAAGLDASSFKPVDPTWAPPMAIDQRAAWEGAHPERPDLPIRLEAAAYRGNLVAFRTLGPWDAAASAPVGARFATSGVIVGLLVMGVSIGGLWIAWLNVRAGRGDRRGAFRLGLTVLTANTIDWALTTDHVAGPGQLALTYLGLSGALYEAVGAYLLYLALEPYVRRRWPHVLISWSRALAGELRDPLVGRHVLIGLLFGALWTVGTVLAFGVRGEMLASNLGGVGTLRDSLDVVAAAVAGALFISVVFCFLIFILRAALRAAWAAGAAVALATAVIGAGGLPIVNMVGAIAGAVFGTLLVVAMIRFGLMAAAAMMFCYAVLAFRPLTLNFSTWYAGPSIVALAALGALAAVACAVAIGWQPTSRPRT